MSQGEYLPLIPSKEQALILGTKISFLERAAAMEFRENLKLSEAVDALHRYPSDCAEIKIF